MTETSLDDTIRALRLDRRNVALPGLVLVIVGLVAAFVFVAVGPWWAPILTFPVISHLQYRLVLSGHEAVHGTLCWPERLNEAIGVAGQALVGVNFASYRVQHLDHHRARTVADDPDGHIYGPIVAQPPGWRRWTLWFFGTALEIAKKVVQKGVGSIGTENHVKASDESVALSRWHTAAVVLSQMALILVTWNVTGRITGYLELWFGPLMLAVLVNRTRILVEHGLALLEGVPTKRGVPTMDLVAPVWERWFFAPFLFNYHASHHLHLTVPHYNLPALHRALRDAGTPGYQHVHGSYLSALARTMTLPAPERT